MSSWIDRSMPWLGVFPLAVDLANTAVIIGPKSLDLLVSDEDLETWVEAEIPRWPIVRAALGHVDEVRRLRERVRLLLFAAAEGRPLPKDALRMINGHSSRAARFPTLGEDGSIRIRDKSSDAFTEFCGSVARSTIEILGGDARSKLGICGAPSCGMLFVAAAPRQTWCSSACGNRARVARHAARSRERSSLGA